MPKVLFCESFLDGLVVCWLRKGGGGSAMGVGVHHVQVVTKLQQLLYK